MRSARPTSTTAPAITQATAAMIGGNVAHRALQRSTRHAWRYQRRHKRRAQLCLLGLQAIETAWRSAGADVGIKIDSILIVESNRTVGFSSMGPLSRRPWSAFQANVRTVCPLARYQHCVQPALGPRAVAQMEQEQELAAAAPRIASTRRLL